MFQKHCNKGKSVIFLVFLGTPTQPTALRCSCKCVHLLGAAEAAAASLLQVSYNVPGESWILLVLPPRLRWSVKWWITDSSSSHSLFACFWHHWLGAVTWSIKDDYYALISQSQINDWSAAITEQDTSDRFSGRAEQVDRKRGRTFVLVIMTPERIQSRVRVIHSDSHLLLKLVPKLLFAHSLIKCPSWIIC